MKIIFWDYDGIIVNTEPFYKKSIEEYFKEKNLLLKDISEEYFFEHISGKHPEDFVLKLKIDGFIKNNIDVNCQDVKTYYSNYFKNLKKGEIKVIENIDNIIEKLSKLDNLIMCITSSSFIHDFEIKNRNIDNEILNKNFAINKNIYLCGSIINCKFKPFPDIFNYALNDIIKKHKLNLTEKDELFIIEDSVAGCCAGLAFKKNINKLQIKIIGVNINPYINAKNLIESGADIVLNNADDIYSIIMQY
ncbi:MAG TPA: HAD family phosphatase [Rickettsiales bacterium]|nr:HAD family phosphatase [Rickettsiales bacterium]